jgi:hypothetical protein
MKIFDCFPYWREQNHVMARKTLWDSHPELNVTMVAVCGTHTHQGEAITDLDDPIRNGKETWVVVGTCDLSNQELGVWQRENAQRNALSGYIYDLAGDDDLIILSDADEIVNPDKISEISQYCLSYGPVCLGMTLFYYGIEWASPSPWIHGKAFLKKQMPDNLSVLRTNLTLPVVPNAGWHVSWVGGDKMREEKAKSFSHAEFSSDTAISSIQRNTRLGMDPHGTPLVKGDKSIIPSSILPFFL